MKHSTHKSLELTICYKDCCKATYCLEKDTVHKINRCYSEVSCASYIVTHKLILYPHSQALYHDGQCCQRLHCRHRHRRCQPHLAIISATDLPASQTVAYIC